MKHTIELDNKLKQIEKDYDKSVLEKINLKSHRDYSDSELNYFDLSLLDLRLSNKCNLACRSCSPEQSSVLADEEDIKIEYLQKFFNKPSTTYDAYSKELDITLRNISN